jgi:hypothetical protein
MRAGRGGEEDGEVAWGSNKKLTLERVSGGRQQQIRRNESAAAELRKDEVHRYTKEVNGEEGGVEGLGAAAAKAPSKEYVGGASSRWRAAPAGEIDARSAQKRTTPDATGKRALTKQMACSAGRGKSCEKRTKTNYARGNRNTGALIKTPVREVVVCERRL